MTAYTDLECGHGIALLVGLAVLLALSVVWRSRSQRQKETRRRVRSA